jgi:hypothetical protein
VQDWWIIFKKWFTNCIPISALFNAFVFLVLMRKMEGKTTTHISGLRERKSLSIGTCFRNRLIIVIGVL